ncbi:MFS transporter [Arthrobacter sp. ISL-69]|uniref:MFS transporter n=1 Tax=Arthrobacter sp. ISL-69 TaxID=2819113 RepID=UPI00203602EE|nr:MFS transporter [Arthrobacter sp. ISL-69]
MATNLKVEQSPRSVSAAASKRRSMMASTVGNVLEWYEWGAYAVFAPFIAKAMFNSQDSVSALLSTLAVFAVGFLMRPLGGIVFGRIADVKGRKFVLITTMLMMAGGSLLIGLMPTYGQIGVAGSLLLLLARVAQGFAHGGESATANTYIAEIAPRNKRGQWGSIVFMAIFGGSVLAFTIGGGVTNILSDSAVAEWGWRIPFLFGAVLALAALYMRRSMAESEVFDGQQEEQALNTALALDRKKIVRSILMMIGMTAGITAAHYTWTSYASTYAITRQGMDAEGAYWVTVFAQLIALASLPLW